MKGSITKRCPCPPSYSPKGERLACKTRHGSWAYVADAGRDPATGKRRQVKKSGFPTRAEAEAALAEAVDAQSKGVAVHDGRQTVEAFFWAWLEQKLANGLRPTTGQSYRDHIIRWIVPTIGRVRLRDVQPAHVDQVLRAAATAKLARPLGPATVRRVHATMRSGFGTAKRQRLISFNPAADIDLPSAPRPKVRPLEPGELGQFLDAIASDPLGPFFELVAGSGLRRGEALGLRWTDIDLERRRLVVRQQIVALSGDQPACATCGRLHKGAQILKPKTASGEDRIVDLDATVIGVLISHRLEQDAARTLWGAEYSDHSLVFALPDGSPIRPDTVTRRFTELAAAAGVRKVRLHDLRHGRASLLMAAGVDIGVVSKVLGHSSIAITADTYSHLLENVGRDAADRASALVPRRPRADVVTTAGAV